MTRMIPRLVAGTLAMACGGLAFPAPPVIDTEQKAASALVTAANTIHSAPLYHGLISSSIVRTATVALTSLQAATTPEALLAAPAGITIPCATSGNLTARMAARKPRVLKLEWQDCHFPQFGWPSSLNGPGEIVLLSDTFAPTSVASIRLGDARRDLVQTRELVTPDQTNHDTWLRNLRMTGVIPLSTYAGAGATTSFAYLITGFIDETNELSFPDRASQTYGSRMSMESLAFSGSVGYDDTTQVVTEDLRALFGGLVFEARQPPPYGDGRETMQFDNLRVRTVVDYGASWSRTTTLDGRLEYQWLTLRAPGCLNGSYSFRTLTPLKNSLNSFERFDAGALDINRKVRASFYSATTVPPGLPTPQQGMLIQNQVPGVGTFFYDVDSLRPGLRIVSGCDG